LSGALSIDPPASFGQMLKSIRTSLQLTRREVAECFGVTTKEVSLFERDLPVGQDAKIKILRQLYPERARNHEQEKRAI
jgi:transcriptional regulator with XRE-family HTH domain